jgi:hypothetical protein
VSSNGDKKRALKYLKTINPQYLSDEVKARIAALEAAE